MTLSNVAVFFMVEGEASSSDAPAREPFGPALRKTLHEARSVAPLLVAIVTVSLALSVESFMVVSALERLHLSDSYAGIFASVTLAAQGVGGAVSGRVGDRIGHARALVASLGVQILAFALVIEPTSRAVFYVALVLNGIAYAAMQITLAGLTARLAPKGSQGAFMAIMRWVVQVASAIATAAAALVVDHAGYAVLFGACIVPLLVSMFVARLLGRRELA
jgi:MFS family permease